VQEFEEIGAFIPQVEEAVKDSTKFMKVVNLAGFRAFKNAAAALENINSISEGILSQDLSAFLQTNMPNTGKKKSVTLGVSDPKLGTAISESLGINVTHFGLIRGIRFHLTHFIKGLNSASMKQTELGLGHSYSRGKVKFNVNRVDNMIIQSIALIDQLDKDINSFAMRIREWYSYHFPELAKVVTDNYQYALCASYIKNRNLLNQEMFDKLEEITGDSEKAQAIFDVARMSMGMDISPIDLLNIEVFAKRVASLAEYRQKLAAYLRSKMNAVAPNLSTLIGEVVGARALKTKGKTPKYGLIYHSAFIGKAAVANKGRISRYVANKCSLASRIDCFAEVQTTVFGEKLKTQVEDRLKFYEVGELPRTNLDVMAEAVVANNEVVKKIVKKENKKKRKLLEMQEQSEEVEMETPKKKKKKKHNEEVEAQNGNTTLEISLNESSLGESAKKKKKKRKHAEEEEEISANQSVNVDSSLIVDDDDEKVSKKKKKKRKSKSNEEE
ncbi:Nucleolar protein 56, partial [Armadillidium nasatum]